MEQGQGEGKTRGAELAGEGGDTVYATASSRFLLDALNIQEDNDLPVHLKGGGIDNVLYRLTMALCVGGKCEAGLGLSLQEAFSTWSVEGLVPRLGFGERAD